MIFFFFLLQVVPRQYKNDQFSIFSIDREFLEKNDEAKLQERARRFNLGETEVKKKPTITLKELERLYNSMGKMTRLFIFKTLY